MSDREAWWLMKNAITPMNSNPDHSDKAQVRGDLSPNKMLPHQQQRVIASGMLPPVPPADQAKHEMFGGGRRQR